ncbi:hypothetical protein PL18_06350 [Vibrio renipiscarius]|uniref:Uncharacterized protein n=1 Tax=Vibrio renipiscarius TaxID=1461322 RepID=A0A0C2JQ60_9VIBR|nr:hypothetical protein PL18_06350 [Vibrio renipiscarius]KII82081.1 hypothetical protein OJ16_02550 [Vibrio renipiscarius]
MNNDSLVVQRFRCVAIKVVTLQINCAEKWLAASKSLLMCRAFAVRPVVRGTIIRWVGKLITCSTRGADIKA